MIADLPNVGAQFRAARPFPHIVLAQVFKPEAITAAAAEVPSVSDERWTRRRNKVAPNKPEKLGIENLSDLPPAIAGLAAAMTSWEFTDWLAEISGIDDLVADTTLAGAGLHGVQRGGSLGIHVDFDRLGPLYRRLNAFVYLNEGWEAEWGGALELHGEGPAVVIPPTLGTFVAFETSDHSWHGHPYPLRCPDGRLRASLAVYYYTASRPDWYREDHSTIYRELEGQ